MNETRERVLFEGARYPVFQNLTYADRSAARNCPKGDIRLAEDLDTGLVANTRFDPALLAYDEDYQNEQALSPSFRAHLEEVATIVEATLGRSGLVEAGCGKAFFLEMLAERGFEIEGFDPAYEGDNPKVRKEPLRPDTGLAAEGLILRHVLEHVRDPVAFLALLRDANGGSGRIYIEVPCFEWICARRAWFDVFYEHVNYFRLSDFERMFGTVLRQGRVFGDQYIYVVAELASLRTPRYDPADPAPFPEDFALTPGTLDELRGDGPLCVWGGASKGVVFALMAERAGCPVSMVVDINPAKQGRYLPATGLRVESPETALRELPDGARVLVMNSNYLEEISQMTDGRFDYRVVDR